MTTCFVYGTLKPGECRWLAIADYVASPVFPDSIDGTLYDTGYGWPAAVVGDEGMVPGYTVPILDEALDILDQIEGVPSLFERHLVQTHGGLWAWVYHWPHDTEGMERIKSW